MPMTAARYYTAAEIGTLTGRKAKTITSLARRHNLGQRAGSIRLYTDADLELIRKIDPKGGNKNGKPRGPQAAKGA